MRDVAEVSACILRKDRGGGCAGGSRRAAAGRAPSCTGRGAGKAAAAWPRGAERPRAEGQQRGRRCLLARSARCRPIETTTAAVASVDSGYLLS